MLKPVQLPEEEAPTKKLVKKAQRCLKKAGYYDGKASGKLNKAMKKAVKKKRKAAGLPGGTRVEGELICLLKSENDGIAAEDIE